jgi:carboxyl-terminal processing protease
MEAEQRKLEEALKNRKPVEFGGTDDWQLLQAMNHLKGQPVIQNPKTSDTETKAGEKKK